MLSHARTVPQPKKPIEPIFYRCNICGRWISGGRLAKAYKGKALCWCGGKHFRKTNPPLWWEIGFLIRHPSYIKKTLLNPFNWGDWRKYFG